MFSFFKKDPKNSSDKNNPAENNQDSDQNKNTVPAQKPSLFARLTSSLSRTRTQLSTKLANLVLGRKEIDAELLQQLEKILLEADIGIVVTKAIIKQLTDNLNRQQLKNPDDLFSQLKSELERHLVPLAQPLQVLAEKKPFVIMMIGVNGTGKTTSIGKLAHQFVHQGYSLSLAAGDTFRAAAVEQLQVWADRLSLPLIKQQTGADSASVIFDALQSAQAKEHDILIADTAGRLHTKSNLMDELKKIKRVLGKLDPSAPHEVLLVIDATTGQNALQQAAVFTKEIGVTGLILTKLDGTARGGIVFAIGQQLGLPIRYIGVGEGIEDLRPFDAKAFVEALFEETQ
jgi:fused signal recognition particle receptor